MSQPGYHIGKKGREVVVLGVLQGLRGWDLRAKRARRTIDQFWQCVAFFASFLRHIYQPTYNGVIYRKIGRKGALISAWKGDLSGQDNVGGGQDNVGGPPTFLTSLTRARSRYAHRQAAKCARAIGATLDLILYEKDDSAFFMNASRKMAEMASTSTAVSRNGWLRRSLASGRSDGLSLRHCPRNSWNASPAALGGLRPSVATRNRARTLLCEFGALDRRISHREMANDHRSTLRPCGWRRIISGGIQKGDPTM
mmetsp:Transcript_3256/g.10701  ORF Transcript_3256/g.10701 Transcript_3256/m.10701 type:complete len:254 (-) Transcript_3256:1488-2249(-)